MRRRLAAAASAVVGSAVAVGVARAGGILAEMTDESRREERPLEPLRREVEPPRTAAGLWLPFMALASAAMLTITSAIAVMTRAPRVRLIEPAEVDALVREASAPMDAQPRVMCRAPVHRGNVDGEAQPYDECIVPPDVAPQ